VKFHNTFVLSHKDLQTYCDFAEVVDISIRQASKDGTNMNRIVSISRQDGKILVSLLLLSGISFNCYSILKGLRVPLNYWISSCYLRIFTDHALT